MMSSKAQAIMSMQNGKAREIKENRKLKKENLKNSIRIYGEFDDTSDWLKYYIMKLTKGVVEAIRHKDSIEVFLLKDTLFRSYIGHIEVNPLDIIYRFKIPNEVFSADYGSYKFTKMSKDIAEYLKKNEPSLMI